MSVSVLQFETIPVTHYQQNCSLIWCEHTREAALVDPGGEPDRIRERVAAREVKLGQILLTHGHLDHVGAVSPLAEYYKVPVIGPHEDDRFWLDMLDQQAQMMGFTPVPAVVPTRYLREGDTVCVGESRLEVFHCPGHTPGHIVLVDRQARLDRKSVV